MTLIFGVIYLGSIQGVIIFGSFRWGSKIPRGSMGVWKLAWPSIITNLFYATSSIVAIKVVGNLGPDAIAAAVTGQRVTFILQASSYRCFSRINCTYCKKLGSNDKLEAGEFFLQEQCS